jgi:DNA-binding SARP family transcriptional activator
MQGVTLDAGVSFAVLGPLEVRQDGRLVEIGGQRLRALLTLLLLDAGRTVPIGARVAGVWEDRPPGGVGNALQALVSRLRNTEDRIDAPSLLSDMRGTPSPNSPGSWPPTRCASACAAC